jgi:hypothetical protein
MGSKKFQKFVHMLNNQLHATGSKARPQNAQEKKKKLVTSPNPDEKAFRECAPGIGVTQNNTTDGVSLRAWEEELPKKQINNK